MSSRYILYLYKQYCSSIGKEFNKLNIFIDFDFIDWLEEINNNTNIYRTYLESLNIELGCFSAVEIGKGKYDSLGKENVSIVSPFAETLGLQKSSLIIHNDEPIIVSNSSIYKIDECNLFLTHNPFSENDIKNMIMIHNIGLNICLGIYGDNNDKDRIEKLKILKNIMEQLDNDLKFYYDTQDINYFACIKSERKVLKKQLYL